MHDRECVCVKAGNCLYRLCIYNKRYMSVESLYCGSYVRVQKQCCVSVDSAAAVA
jgi:hypothetical protein